MEECTLLATPQPYKCRDFGTMNSPFRMMLGFPTAYQGTVPCCSTSTQLFSMCNPALARSAVRLLLLRRDSGIVLVVLQQECTIKGILARYEH